MKVIRTKPKTDMPKALDKATRLPQTMKNTLVNTRDKAKAIDTRDAHGTPENYATDQVSGKASDAAQKAAHETVYRSKQIVNRGRQELTKRFQQNASQTGRRSAKYAMKGTTKTVDKSVKTAKHAVKATMRTIKTSAQAAKTAAKSTKATAKVSIRAAQATARAAAAAVKLLAKAATASAKAVAAAIKALVAAIAAGGWIVVIVVIVIAVMAMILGSAFGIFFANDAAKGMPLTDAIVQINTDFQAEIDGAISRLSSSETYDDIKIVYEGDGDGDSANINNWTDVLDRICRQIYG